MVIFQRKGIIGSGSLSQLIQCMTDYQVERIKGLPFNSKERTVHLLEKTEGYFIAVLQDTSDACHHCICIDGTKNLSLTLQNHHQSCLIKLILTCVAVVTVISI